eukprot:tig00020801_g13914.t1
MAGTQLHGPSLTVTEPSTKQHLDLPPPADELLGHDASSFGGSEYSYTATESSVEDEKSPQKRHMQYCPHSDAIGFVDRLLQFMHQRMSAAGQQKKKADGSYFDPASLGIYIPHTLVYRGGALVGWFYSDPESGNVVQVQKSKVTIKAIMETFGRPTREGGDIVAYYMGVRKRRDPASPPKGNSPRNSPPGSPRDSPPPQSPPSPRRASAADGKPESLDPLSFRYFDTESLKQFLWTAKNEDGMIQQFVYPADAVKYPHLDKEVTYRVTYLPENLVLEQRANHSRLSDHALARAARCSTFFGPDYLSVNRAIFPSNGLRRIFERAARGLVELIEELKPKNKVRLMILHVKIDREGRLWLLWCSALRLTDPSGQSVCLQCERHCRPDADGYVHSLRARHLQVRAGSVEGATPLQAPARPASANLAYSTRRPQSAASSPRPTSARPGTARSGGRPPSALGPRPHSARGYAYGPRSASPRGARQANPREEEAARRIQGAARSFLARRRIAHAAGDAEVGAAVRLQAAWRGYAARRTYRMLTAHRRTAIEELLREELRVGSQIGRLPDTRPSWVREKDDLETARRARSAAVSPPRGARPAAPPPAGGPRRPGPAPASARHLPRPPARPAGPLPPRPRPPAPPAPPRPRTPPRRPHRRAPAPSPRKGRQATYEDIIAELEDHRRVHVLAAPGLGLPAERQYPDWGFEGLSDEPPPPPPVPPRASPPPRPADDGRPAAPTAPSPPGPRAPGRPDPFTPAPLPPTDPRCRRAGPAPAPPHAQGRRPSAGDAAAAAAALAAAVASEVPPPPASAGPDEIAQYVAAVLSRLRARSPPPDGALSLALPSSGSGSARGRPPAVPPLPPHPSDPGAPSPAGQRRQSLPKSRLYGDVGLGSRLAGYDFQRFARAEARGAGDGPDLPPEEGVLEAGDLFPDLNAPFL